MQQVTTQQFTFNLASLKERVDDAIIAEMIVARFHGPFLSGEDLEKRIDILHRERKEYVSRRVSSPRGR